MRSFQLLSGRRRRRVVGNLHREVAQLRPTQSLGQGIGIRERRREALQVRVVVFVHGEDERDALLLGHSTYWELTSGLATNLLSVFALVGEMSIRLSRIDIFVHIDVGEPGAAARSPARFRGTTATGRARCRIGCAPVDDRNRR